MSEKISLKSQGMCGPAYSGIKKSKQIISQIEQSEVRLHFKLVIVESTELDH